MDFSQAGGGLQGTGSSGTLADLCTAPEHVALLGWAQHPWPERGPWVSSTGSRYCTEQNEVHRCRGGWKQGRMVIGLRFFHTLGTVGLFQDCEQGGGRILGPREDFVSSAAQCCRCLPRKPAVTTPAHLRVSPGAALPHTPRDPGGSSPVLPGLAADGAERAAGRGRTQPEVPASSARSPCLQHSLTPRTGTASPGRSPQWSVR